MTVEELNRDQLIELKGRYYDAKLYEQEGRGASYGEFADADDLVTDEEILKEYAGTDFTNDDFSCTAGLSEEIFDADARNTNPYVMEAAEKFTIGDMEKYADVVCAC